MSRLTCFVMQWRKVHQPPFKPLYRRPKSIENCNLAMAVMRDKMRLQLVNIGGEDIVNAEGKLIRALLWQLMRCHSHYCLAAVVLHSSPRLRATCYLAAAT